MTSLVRSLTWISQVLFSAKIPVELRKYIVEELGIREDQNPRIYLGIPSFWRKSKCDTMGYIRDRVLAKLKGWK